MGNCAGGEVRVARLAIAIYFGKPVWQNSSIGQKKIIMPALRSLALISASCRHSEILLDSRYENIKSATAKEMYRVVHLALSKGNYVAASVAQSGFFFLSDSYSTAIICAISSSLQPPTIYQVKEYASNYDTNNLMWVALCSDATNLEKGLTPECLAFLQLWIGILVIWN